MADFDIVSRSSRRPHPGEVYRRPGGALPPGGPAGVHAEEDRLVAAFLSGRSRATPACYRVDLGHLRRALAKEKTSLLGATQVDYGRLVRAAEASGVAPATIRRRLAAAGAFYRFLVTDGHLAASPLEGVRHPHGASAPHLGPDPAALRRLWAAACRHGGRVQLLVGLLLVAGLRVSEAAGIDADDVSQDAGRRCARVVRKGARRGLVALVPPLCDLVAAAIARQGPGPLLRGARGGPLGRQRAWEIVRALGEEAGVVGLGPHALRHAHVTAAQSRSRAHRGPGLGRPRRPPDHRPLRPGAPGCPGRRGEGGGRFPRRSGGPTRGRLSVPGGSCGRECPRWRSATLEHVEATVEAQNRAPFEAPWCLNAWRRELGAFDPAPPRWRRPSPGGSPLPTHPRPEDALRGR